MFKKIIWSVIGVSVLVIVFVIAISSGSKSAQSVAQQSFVQIAQNHFTQVQSSIPEMHDYLCQSSSCIGVVYFNFTKLPTDLETIVRGNAAIYSKLEMDNSVGSHVTVIAQINGKSVIQCNAADGAVTSCSDQ